MSFRTRVGVSELEVACVIGANADERDREQAVLISFEIEYGPGGPATDDLEAAVNYADAADRVRGISQTGRYLLLETLARAVAEELSRDERVGGLTVECRKPGALPDAAYAYARVTWARD